MEPVTFLLPGSVLHERLHTSYLNLPRYLQFLKADRFTGRVEILYDLEGFIVDYYDGTFVRAFHETRTREGILEEVNWEPMESEEALLSALRAIPPDREGWVSAHTYSPDVFLILLTEKDADPVVVGVEGTTFDLSTFLEEVSYSSFTGYLVSEPERDVMLFIAEGRPVLAVVRDEETSVEEAKNLLKKRKFSIFSVEKAIERMETRHTQEILEELLTDAYRQLERLVVSTGDTGPGFDLVLREVMRERAEAHPFLDPLVGNIDISRDRIRMEAGEAVTPEELARRLWECMQEAIRRTIQRKGLGQLETLVESEIQEIQQKLNSHLGQAV